MLIGATVQAAFIGDEPALASDVFAHDFGDGDLVSHAGVKRPYGTSTLDKRDNRSLASGTYASGENRGVCCAMMTALVMPPRL